MAKQSDDLKPNEYDLKFIKAEVTTYLENDREVRADVWVTAMARKVGDAFAEAMRKTHPAFQWKWVESGGLYHVSSDADIKGKRRPSALMFGGTFDEVFAELMEDYASFMAEVDPEGAVTSFEKEPEPTVVEYGSSERSGLRTFTAELDPAEFGRMTARSSIQHIASETGLEDKPEVHAMTKKQYWQDRGLLRVVFTGVFNDQDAHDEAKQAYKLLFLGVLPYM